MVIAFPFGVYRSNCTAGIGKDAFFRKQTSWGLPYLPNTITKFVRQQIFLVLLRKLSYRNDRSSGPVVIDLLKDVSALETDFIYSPEVNLPSYQPTLDPNDMQIKKILKQLSKAKKPVCWQAVASAMRKLLRKLNEFAERYQIPVVTSLLGQKYYCNESSALLGMGCTVLSPANMLTKRTL